MTRRWTRATVIALAVALAAALAAGCSDGDDEGGSEADDGDPGAAGPGSEEAVPPPDVPTEAEVVLTFAPDADVSDEALGAAVAVVEQRIAALDVEGAAVAVDDGKVVVGLPDDADADEVAAAVEKRGELRFRPVRQVDHGGTGDVTPAADDDTERPVTLEGTDGAVYQLGPTEATGEIVETAEATVANGEWQVQLTLRTGADGIDLFNDLAAACFATEPSCPLGQLAITLDSVVQSAPMIQQPSFERDQISIVGRFDERSTKELAAVLVAGTLPFGLERQG